MSDSTQNKAYDRLDFQASLREFSNTDFNNVPLTSPQLAQLHAKNYFDFILAKLKIKLNSHLPTDVQIYTFEQDSFILVFQVGDRQLAETISDLKPATIQEVIEKLVQTLEIPPTQES